MIRPFALLTASVLAGCGALDLAADANKFTGPNGRPAYAMVCSGIGQSMQRCRQAADDLCRSGYDVLEHTTIALSGHPRETFSIECR